MSLQPPAIQLLQACVDEADDSYFRFLVEERAFKYVTIATGIYDVDDLCFAPALIPLLPDFPRGDWNEGHVNLDPSTKKPFFSKLTRRQLPSVKSAWHQTRIDYIELNFDEKLRTGIYEARCSDFESAVIVKFARFAWEIDAVERECAAYQWIEGQDIGPRFLGHVTEEGRVIGFIMEKITDARHATPDDFELCRKALSRLHDLGIVHGDVNKHNFLVTGERAFLIDFEDAKRSRDQSELKRESEALSIQLSDTSGKGGSQLMN